MLAFLVLRVANCTNNDRSSQNYDSYDPVRLKKNQNIACDVKY